MMDLITRLNRPLQSRWLSRVVLCAIAFLTACGSDPATSPTPPVTVTPRVLMLVANNGFFYQEYADTRAAIEARGIQVDVASVDGGTAIPHAASYDGRFTGLTPTIANITGTLRLADVSAANYSALVIVGGWGAARYYYAYPGTFVETSWQRSAPAADAVNTLIGQFVAAGKTILAICNGVNVLAWARVPGPSGPVSPLAGRTVRAPWGSAPAQSYLGVSYGTSWTVDQACPWEPVAGSNCFRMGKFATDNGAIVPNPYNSVAGVTDPTDLNRRDAVSIDGNFITVQDNFSARTGGQRLAERLVP